MNNTATIACRRFTAGSSRWKKRPQGEIRSDVQGVEGVHEVVEVVLGLLDLVRLALGDADRQANCVTAIPNQLAVAFLGGDGQGVIAAEQPAQVDLESRDAADGRSRDGRGL